MLISSRTTSAPFVAVTSVTRPAEKRTERSRTICPFTTSGIVERTTPSVRRRCGVVKTSSVGMFTTISTPVVVMLRARRPARLRDQPDEEVGARASEAHAVEGPLVEDRRPLAELRDVRAPGGDRIVLVEARGDRDGVPEPLDVGLAEHRLGPAGVRVADDRPRDLAVTGRLQHLLGDEPGPRLGDAGRIEVGEELGLGVAGDRDQGAVLLRELSTSDERPRRRPVERVLRRVDDPRPPDVWIGVERLDVLGAALVGDLGDRADQRQVIRMPGDPHAAGRAGG